MKKKLLVLAGATTILFEFFTHASAGLIDVNGCLSSFNGAAAILDPAPNMVLDSMVFNASMEGFDEKQNVLLTSDLSFDNGGIISAGSWVSSHMIFLNRDDHVSSPVLQHLDVSWTFDGIVLGVMSDNYGTLERDSNSILGLDTTTYPGRFNNRGFEKNNPDTYSGVGTDALTVSMYVTQPGDWIRVVTQAKPVPEPTTMLLFGTGLIGLARVARRKKK